MNSSMKVRSKMLRLLGVAGVVLATSLPGAAFAEGVGDYGGGGNNNGGNNGSQGSGGSGTSGEEGGLPFTGGDIVGLALIGAGAVAGGAALSRSGRRTARAGPLHIRPVHDRGRRGRERAPAPLRVGELSCEASP